MGEPKLTGKSGAAATVCLLAGYGQLAIAKFGPPRRWREFVDPIDREVGQAWQDGAQVVANRNAETPAGFDD